MDWKKGALTRAVIYSKLGKPCVIRAGSQEAVLSTEAGKEYVLDGALHQ
jgi:hypothetical protein